MYLTLQKYLRPKKSPRLIMAFVALLPCLALISWLFIGFECHPDAIHPGGSFLEISYWATSLGAVFLSFMMMELLFRSRETRILATYPVPPLAIFAFQMRRAFLGIGVSTLAYLVFWLPQLIAEPVITALCVLLWPLGLSICAALAAAIILYAGNHAVTETRSAGAGAMAFSMAPAIALAVSLMTTLLLKLLAEALLKPGFFDAALTAALITAAVFAIAMIYAARLYQKRYYAILAGFMDNDLVVLNASYEFLDDREAKRLRATPQMTGTLEHAMRIQYRRRHPMTSMLVVTFAVIIGLVLWQAPQYISYLYVGLGNVFMPCFVIVPTLIFAKPWAILRSPTFETDLNTLLPLPPKQWTKARLQASLKLTMPYHLILSVCAALPIALQTGWMAAGLTFLLSLVTCIGITWVCHWIATRYVQHAVISGYVIAVISMLIGILI